MYDLSILTAEERLLAKQYRLKEYFRNNRNYLLYVLDIIRASDRRFKETTQVHWVRDKFVELTRVILECSDEFFEHVNDIHANKYKFRNISKGDWKHVCDVGSKILVQTGWNYEMKRLTVAREKWLNRMRKALESS